MNAYLYMCIYKRMSVQVIWSVEKQVSWSSSRKVCENIAAILQWGICQVLAQKLLMQHNNNIIIIMYFDVVIRILVSTISASRTELIYVVYFHN